MPRVSKILVGRDRAIFPENSRLFSVFPSFERDSRLQYSTILDQFSRKFREKMAGIDRVLMRVLIEYWCGYARVLDSGIGWVLKRTTTPVNFKKIAWSFYIFAIFAKIVVCDFKGYSWLIYWKWKWEFTEHVKMSIIFRCWQKQTKISQNCL